MGVLFGTKARDARVEREVSLKTVADALGFTAAYISDIERGNRNPPVPEKVMLWARIIGEDPDEFVMLAARDRPSVELPIAGDPARGELAYMLARAWTEMTPDQERDLMAYLQKKFGGKA